MANSKVRVYISASDKTDDERAYNETVNGMLLGLGCEVFLPQAIGVITGKKGILNEALANEVFRIRHEELGKADVLLAVTPIHGEKTFSLSMAYEIGYFRSLDKPIVYIGAKMYDVLITPTLIAYDSWVQVFKYLKEYAEKHGKIMAGNPNG